MTCSNVQEIRDLRCQKPFSPQKWPEYQFVELAVSNSNVAPQIAVIIA
jgi:hypothetical protein